MWLRPQVLANIEAAQRQNRLYDALKQGTVALKALQKVRVLEQRCPQHVLSLEAAEVHRHMFLKVCTLQYFQQSAAASLLLTKRVCFAVCNACHLLVLQRAWPHARAGRACCCSVPGHVRELSGRAAAACLAHCSSSQRAPGQEVSVEDVEALREDTAAAGEAERRVRELLAESLSAEDDAAALQELAALEEAEDAAEAARLPAAPAKAPVRNRSGCGAAGSRCGLVALGHGVPIACSRPSS